MATYPTTGSNLDSKTRTGLSTQIIIMVNNEPVGAVQSFQENQAKPLRRLQEIGTDGIVEIVPQSATTVDVTIQRIVFDGLSITESMARGFRNLASQRIPFDIVVIDNYTGTGDEAVITTYKNCWFASIGKTYNSGDYIITENATVQAEYMFTTRGFKPTALSPGTGGARQLAGTQKDHVEMQVDAGIDARRGPLDFPGLISAAYS
jgi:hypothetical protein